MTTIKIDDKEYELETLPDEVKGNLMSMQFCDAELQRLQAMAAAFQTARMAYARAVSEGLKNSTVTAPMADISGDTIKFN